LENMFGPHFNGDKEKEGGHGVASGGRVNKRKGVTERERERA
jgi:hypothetical protein